MKISIIIFAIILYVFDLISLRSNNDKMSKNFTIVTFAVTTIILIYGLIAT